MVSCYILDEVFNVIKDRKINPKESSYTSKLMREGEEKILRKINEECLELILASKDNSKSKIVHEATDLIFHIMVLLCYKDIELEDIYKEFKNRRR